MARTTAERLFKRDWDAALLLMQADERPRIPTPFQMLEFSYLVDEGLLVDDDTKVARTTNEGAAVAVHLRRLDRRA